MDRVQAIEFEDFPWFPDTIRDYMTDFFHFQMTRFKLYDPILPKLKDAMDAAGTRRAVDLCSGGGGPWLQLHRAMAETLDFDVAVTLTDRYPNVPAFEAAAQHSGGRIDHVAEPIDATDVPASLPGFRTVFSAFHHFPPPQARAILQDAVDKERGIGVFELSNRSPASFLQVMVAGPLSMLLLTPLFRPFRLGRFLWTYLVPIVPVAAAWDGVASNLRAYRPDELRALVDEVDGADRFRWEIDVLRVGPAGVRITYLLGVPKAG